MHKQFGRRDEQDDWPTQHQSIREITERIDRIDQKVNRNHEQIQEQLAQILAVVGETTTERENRQNAQIQHVADATGVKLPHD
ncbi:hypothetical protein ACQP1G_37150 [Nocardia sp. CA-107356]|uniref:hypothetical protein n=1 Tax=Nocardia sp. CA-107356 TaxID=3239972 RepID=UPI003D91DBF2